MKNAPSTSGVGYAQSYLRATLQQGQSYTIGKYKGQSNLVVTVNEINLSSNPGYADVTLNYGNAVGSPPPTPQPTPLRPTAKPTTSAPTRTCGDNVCIASENNLSCPADCAAVELRTWADNVGGRAANGVMFTVEAYRPVSITSISTFTSTQTTDLMQIYTRQGGYRLYTDSENGWELIFDNVIQQNGNSVLTEMTFDGNRNIVIPTGSVQSFYIYTPSNLVYREEGTEGQEFVRDQSLRFNVGVAIAYAKWGEVFTPRVFSGIIR